MKATMLRDFADVNTNPHQKLYKLDPGGDLPEFVLVSVFRYPQWKNRRHEAPTVEARFLESNEAGVRVGSIEGIGDEFTADHNEALRRRGYEVS